jgi:transposase-like protein
LPEGWSDPIEDGVRGRARAFIEAILEEEREAALGRGRDERSEEGPRGWRNGHRKRQVIGTFGPETVRVPRTRMTRADGKTTEWRSQSLLAHAPKRLHDELTEDYRGIVYTETADEAKAKRKAFSRKWRLKRRPVADSLDEGGARLFTFARLPSEQWKSARTANAIERLHEESKRRIETQTVLPEAETAAMLFWAAVFRPDRHAQGRRMGDPIRPPRRSDD